MSGVIRKLKEARRRDNAVLKRERKEQRKALAAKPSKGA
jgi:hypothetical protein